MSCPRRRRACRSRRRSSCGRRGSPSERVPGSFAASDGSPWLSRGSGTTEAKLPLKSDTEGQRRPLRVSSTGAVGSALAPLAARMSSRRYGRGAVLDTRGIGVLGVVCLPDHSSPVFLVPESVAGAIYAYNKQRYAPKLPMACETVAISL
eukprot:scaffold1954_cov268-Pinguiococcus_pyrenoidosus.AAC.264